MEFIIYNTTDAIPYTAGGTIKRVDNCNGFIAVNTGGDVAYINGQVIYPGVPGTSSGESVSIGGNLGEIYKGYINLKFAGTGSNPEVTIKQKFYIIKDLEQHHVVI